MRIARTALWVAFGGVLTLWATLFAHVWWVFGIKAGYLDGGSYPLTPSVRVTTVSLAIDCAFSAILYLLPAVVVAALPLPRAIRLGLLALIWGMVWLLGAAGSAEIFAFDFGTTWQGSEAFFELFFDPRLTPLAMLVGLALHLWSADRALGRII